MASVELDRVTASYGPHVVVDGLSLTANQAECLALLGPSGCGKTTTLNLVAGFAQPDSGHIRIGGKDMGSVPPYRRNTAMVFQSYALFPHLTVAQNIGFGLEMRRVAKAEIDGRVKRALDLVRLSGFGDRLPKQLSGGQQQRVAVARALAVEPTVLLLDEPLSNLDAQLREEMRFELSDIQRRIGITTIFVTHDQADAMAIADRIVVMNKGKIEQVGAPAELYERPSRKFVASFIGRLNLLEGRVAGTGAQSTRVSFDGREMTCAPLPGISVGEIVHVGIRPEHVEVLGGTGEGSGLPAKVERVTYLGDQRDVALSLGGNSLRVNLSAAAGSPAVGSTVSIGWAADNARLFRREEAA